jgi:hypothetical protein
MPPSPGAPNANMMMKQIQQLQNTVMQLRTTSGQGQGGGPGTGGGNTFRKQFFWELFFNYFRGNKLWYFRY